MAVTYISIAATAQSTLVGQWTPVQNWPYEPVHMILLSTRKVMFWSHFTDSLRPELWDPDTGSFSPTAQPAYEIFCAGHSPLSDGRLLVSGGNVVLGVGYAHASLYNPVTNTWSSLPDMNAGRWYPNNVTLGSGDVAVMSGTIDQTSGNDTLPQVWQVATQSWRDLTSAQLALSSYSHAHLAPNGKLIVVGPSKVTRYLDTSGTGAWTWLGNSNFGTRDYGSSVIYEAGKILLVGGGDPPTATAEIIDLNSSTPIWQYTSSMISARRNLNATVLPDGTVLVTGGSSGAGFDSSSAPVYAAELWNPGNGQWTTLASTTTYRGYHSTALLLPDGRVVSAGGDISGASAEIFSPPYLFHGLRPTITSAPSTVQYGETFFVATPNATSISQVTWLALGSVTHGFDQNQRFNQLSFSQVPGGLNVTAPTNSNLSPAGQDMLFLVNTSGVPSVASIVGISAGVGLSATSLNFPNQALQTSSASDPVSLVNSQLIPLNITGIATSGDFAQTNNCGTLLGPGASCNINVTFTPTTAGGRLGTLTVTDSAGNSPQKATLTGIGLMPVGLSAANLLFGSLVVGATSAVQSVTLKNNLTVALNISGILANGDYAQTNNCSTKVGPGASCTISVSFTPKIVGSRPGTLTVTDDASSSPQTVSLSGTGIVPVALSAGTLSFGNQTVGTSSSAKNVTLKNNQTIPLSISLISTNGDYAQSNNCPSQVSPGASCVISVTFRPTLSGQRLGTLTIKDNASTSPQNVNLSGNGS